MSGFSLRRRADGPGYYMDPLVHSATCSGCGGKIGPREGRTRVVIRNKKRDYCVRCTNGKAPPESNP